MKQPSGSSFYGHLCGIERKALEPLTGIVCARSHLC